MTGTARENEREGKQASRGRELISLHHGPKADKEKLVLEGKRVWTTPCAQLHCSFDCSGIQSVSQTPC